MPAIKPWELTGNQTTEGLTEQARGNSMNTAFNYSGRRDAADCGDAADCDNGDCVCDKDRDSADDDCQHMWQT